jgi:hypothetical protein
MVLRPNTAHKQRRRGRNIVSAQATPEIISTGIPLDPRPMTTWPGLPAGGLSRGGPTSACADAQSTPKSAPNKRNIRLMGPYTTFATREVRLSAHVRKGQYGSATMRLWSSRAAKSTTRDD